MAVDVSELRKLASDLSSAPKLVRSEARAVVSKGALNIKNQMRESFEASGNAGFRHVGRTVSYDLRTEGNELSAEIGPTKPEGALANVAIFGTPRGGGTVADPREALEAEGPRFEKALADLAEELFG